MSDSDTETWIGIAAFGVIAYLAYGYFTEDTETPEEEIAVPAPFIAPARPTGLVYAATSPEDSVWRVDADTIRGERTLRQGWVVIDHSKNSDTPVRETKTLYLINCETTGTKTPSRVDYAPDNSIMSMVNQDADEMPYDYYPPNSMGYAVVEVICGEAYDTPSN